MSAPRLQTDEALLKAVHVKQAIKIFGYNGTVQHFPVVAISKMNNDKRWVVKSVLMYEGFQRFALFCKIVVIANDSSQR